jgi:hypothetical protein
MPTRLAFLARSDGYFRPPVDFRPRETLAMDAWEAIEKTAQKRSPAGVLDAPDRSMQAAPHTFDCTVLHA